MWQVAFLLPLSYNTGQAKMASSMEGPSESRGESDTYRYITTFLVTARIY